MRWSLGTAVFSGMLGVTLFGIFLTPVFFYVIEGLGEACAVPPRQPAVVRRAAAQRRRRLLHAIIWPASRCRRRGLGPRVAGFAPGLLSPPCWSRALTAERSGRRPAPRCEPSRSRPNPAQSAEQQP